MHSSKDVGGIKKSVTGEQKDGQPSRKQYAISIFIFQSCEHKYAFIWSVGNLPSNELLKDNMSKYLAKMAISSHIRCCSRVGVGDVHVLSIN